MENLLSQVDLQESRTSSSLTRRDAWSRTSRRSHWGCKCTTPPGGRPSSADKPGSAAEAAWDDDDRDDGDGDDEVDADYDDGDEDDDDHHFDDNNDDNDDGDDEIAGNDD